jgi:hypothetical protein
VAVLGFLARPRLAQRWWFCSSCRWYISYLMENSFGAIFFIKHSTNIDAYIYAHTLTPMNARMHTLPL